MEVIIIGLLVYLHDQTGYASNNMYHVEYQVDKPPWVTATAGSLANLSDYSHAHLWVIT